MQIRKTQLAAAAVGVAALAALAWAFAPRPVDVEVAAAARGAFEQSVEEDGRTRLRERYTVSAPVAARLTRMTLREGDRVQAGDVVAVLTPIMSSMIDERSRQEANARLRAADASVAGAAARVARARVAREEAQLELHRTEKLAREGFLAPSRLDSARLGLDAARTELDAAVAAQQAAAQERAQAAAVLAPPGAASAGQPLVLRAPVSGEVLRVPLQSEATVAPGTALLDIGDTKRLEVVAELLTTDAVRAVPGSRAVIERWGGPAVQARVRRVEPGAFTKVSALGIEEQRVNVLLDPVDPPPAWERLGDGYRVTVRVITARAEDVVTVPIGALFPHADGGMAVYRLDGSHARLQPVDIAARNGNAGWVRSGLKAGDTVIVYPPPTVADGQRVRVRTP